MKPAAAFLFFLLFLAGFALVNLRSMQSESERLVEAPADLLGPEWRPTHLGEMRMDAESPAFLLFAEGGDLSGNAGCNGLFGTWTLSSGQLIIGQVGATRMACPEPANSLEIAFLEQLEAVRSATRTRNRLVLHDESASAVLRFVATEETGQ
jgi:putative lipoprotein